MANSLPSLLYALAAARLSGATEEACTIKYLAQHPDRPHSAEGQGAHKHIADATVMAIRTRLATQP